MFSALSYHNFNQTPDIAQLKSIIKQAQLLDCNYVKIATMIQNTKENIRLLSLYQEFDNIIAFGMGEKGKISRLASLYLGAPFTYASFSDIYTTAQGQFNYTTLKTLTQLIS